MAIKAFVFALLVLSAFSYFVPVDVVHKKSVDNDIPLLIFDEPIMYTLTTQSMNRIVYSKKAVRYKDRDQLIDGALTFRSIDSKNGEITDTLLSDLIIKRGDNFKFLNNVKFTRNDYVNVKTNELLYNSKTKIATNTLPFEGNYFNHYIKGVNIYLDMNKYYMKADNTHFEIDVKKEIN